ncbi:hypothetical protein ES703_125244 [subsurface metagenome]
MFVAAVKRQVPIAEHLQGLLFIFLNIADAWLTEQLIANGGAEANPIVDGYGASLAIKALLAVLIVAITGITGKARLLRLLNAGMFLVVLWTGGWLLTYL